MNIILLEKGENAFSNSDRRYTHIRDVLRLKENDHFKIGEINGRKGEAVITSITPAAIAFDSFFSGEIEGAYPLDLIVAQVRPISMKRILRDSAQMGVRRLILPVSSLGEKSYTESHLYRDQGWKDLILDGAMQSGKTSLTEVVFPKSVEEAVDIAVGRKILLDRDGEAPLSSLDLTGEEVTLSIGPERGWTEREKELFRSGGFELCTLGDRILRTETAVVFSTSLALSKMSKLK